MMFSRFNTIYTKTGRYIGLCIRTDSILYRALQNCEISNQISLLQRVIHIRQTTDIKIFCEIKITRIRLI